MNQTANNLKSSTLLDAQETTGASLDPSDYRALRIHSVAAEYKASEELYRFIDSEAGSNRLRSLESCRTYAWFVRDIETGLVHVASNSCKLRWCPVCAKARSWWIQSQVFEWTQKTRFCRFLTVTLRHTSAQLSDQIDYLYDCFRRMRKHRQFTKLVTGGVWFFQVTYNKDTEQWHPHIHALISGYYLPKSWLIKLWTHITKGSYICDIKLVKNQKKVADYVARYACRPISLQDFTLPQRVVIFKSFHGRRLAGTWGRAKTVSLSPRTSLAAKRFVKLGTWETVFYARITTKEAWQIYQAWKQQTILDPGITMQPYDDFVDGVELDYEIDSFEKRYPQGQFW